jgi:hypothetical protein
MKSGSQETMKESGKEESRKKRLSHRRFSCFPAFLIHPPFSGFLVSRFNPSRS